MRALRLSPLLEVTDHTKADLITPPKTGDETRCVCGHQEWKHAGVGYVLWGMKFRPCHVNHPPCECPRFEPRPPKPKKKAAT